MFQKKYFYIVFTLTFIYQLIKFQFTFKFRTT